MPTQRESYPNEVDHRSYRHGAYHVESLHSICGEPSRSVPQWTRQALPYTYRLYLARLYSLGSSTQEVRHAYALTGAHVTAYGY